MTKEEKIKCFVPALALEYHSNGESFQLKEKLIHAVLRYFFNEDFFSDIPPETSLPYVLIERRTFIQSALGYEVEALIKCV